MKAKKTKKNLKSGKAIKATKTLSAWGKKGAAY